MIRFIAAAVTSSFACCVVSQTTSRLPAAPKFADGVFTSPDTESTQVYTNGASMNVSWKTSYESIDLYLIFGGKFNQAYTCTSKCVLSAPVLRAC